MSEETTTDNDIEEIHRLSEKLRLPSEAERQNALYLRQAANNIILSVNFNQEDFNQEDFDNIRPLLADTERLEFSIKDLIKNLVSAENTELPETTITESLIKAHSLLEQLEEIAKEIMQKVKEMGYIEVVNEDTKEVSTPIEEGSAPVVVEDIPDKPPVKDVEETNKQLQTPTAFNSDRPSAENAKDLMSYFRRWQNGDVSLFEENWGGSLNEIKNDIRLFLEAVNYSPEEINQFFRETVNPWSQTVKQKQNNRGKANQNGPTWEQLSNHILQTVCEKIQSKEPNSKVFEKYQAKNEKINTATVVQEIKPEGGAGKNESLESLRAEANSVVKNYRDLKKEIVDSRLLETLQYKINDAEGHITNLEKLLADFDLQNKEIAPKIIKKITQRIGKLVDLQQDMRKELMKAKEGGPTTGGNTEAQPTDVSTSTDVDSKPPVSTDKEEDTKQSSGAGVSPEDGLEIGKTLEALFEQATKVIGSYRAIENKMTMQNRAHEFFNEWTQADECITNLKKLFTQLDFVEPNDSIVTEIKKNLESLVTIKDALQKEIENIEAIPDVNSSQTANETQPDIDSKIPDDVASEATSVDTPTTPDFNPTDESSDTSVPNPDIHERQNYTPERRAERQRLSAETRLAKFEMKQAEEAYKQALYQFNVNKSFTDKIIDGFQKLRGQEVTTLFLNKLKAEADEKAELYRKGLLTQIEDRNRDRILKTALKSDSDQLHQAFYNKLVTKVDAGQQSEIAKANIERRELFNNEHPKLIGSLEKISKIIPKNKKVRLGLGLLTAAGFGASAGTVALGSLAAGAVGGALYGGSRWLISTAVGMGVGTLVNRRGEKKIVKAEDRLQELLSGQNGAKTLTIADMRKAVRLAHAEVDSAKLRRTANTMAATIVAGFGTRGLIGLTDLTTDLLPKNIPPVATNEVGQTDNLVPNKIPLNPVFTDEMINTATIEPTKPSVVVDNLNGNSGFQNSSPLDASVDNFIPGQMSGSLTDQISINPEPGIYGGEINKPDITNIFSGNGGGSVPEKIINLTHEVKSGENLSTILHKSLLTQFDEGKIKFPDGIDRDDLAKLLYKKFPELSNPNATHWTLSPEEWKELGVKSGNPHLIHPGEQIDLTKLSAKLVDTDLSVGNNEVSLTHASKIDVLSHPKTGPLPVEQIDPFEHRIKIAQDTPWKPLSTEELDSARAEGILEGTIETAPVELFDKIYHAPISPRPDKFVGDFFNSPTYQEYLRQNNVDLELLENNIKKTIADGEGKTLTWLEEISGKFDSPYHKLSHITIGQLQEIETRVNQNPAKLQLELSNIAGEDTNFKPQTLKVWYDFINQVKKEGAIPYTESTTIADLFKRDMAARMISFNRYNIPAK